MPAILVVDDDPHLRGWLRHILESKGYQVKEAGDGEEALVCIKLAEPALVVLDIFLPNMSGLEFILYTRSCPKPPKILAISGNLFNGDKMCRTAEVLGAQDALAKPFSAETFLQRVEALVSKT